LTTKICFTTDTHYGNSPYKPYLLESMYKDIKERKPDILVNAGDLGMSQLSQIEASFIQMRKILGKKIPILINRGNHDFWNRDGKKEYDFVVGQQKKYFKKYKIHHLSHIPYIFNNIKFLGWDGWYNNTNPPSKDAWFMAHDYNGELIHSYLNKKAYSDFLLVLDELKKNANTKVVVSTHFTLIPNAGWEDFCAHQGMYDELLKYQCDIIHFGHSHQVVYKEVNNTKVINIGSDYDTPKFKIMEI
jgi:predicted phosphodiesterase